LSAIYPLFMSGIFRLLHLVLLILPCALAWSQQVHVSDGVTLRRGDFYEILGRVNNKLLLSIDNGYSLDVYAYDDKLRQVWRKELDLEKRRTQILGMVSDKNHFAVLYQYSRKGASSLKANKYDENGLLLDSVSFFTFPEGNLLPECRMVTSEDQKMALIYYIERPNTLHAMAVNLDSLGMMWYTTAVIDPSSFFQQFRAMLVDNEGMMHLILEKDNRKGQLGNHSLELIQYAEGYSSPLSRHINLQNLLSLRIKFALDNINKRLVCVGLYSDKHPRRAAGVYGFYLDHQTEGQLNLFNLPFDSEIARKVTGSADGLTKGLEDLDIRNLLLRHDGGVVVLLEEFKKAERGISGQQFQFGPMGARFITDYFYEDLIAVSLHPDGRLDWQDVFPKKQYSQDDDGIFSSVYVMRAPDQINLVFNDEIAFENTVSAYRINHRGQMARMSVLSTDYQKLKLIFKEARQTGVRELIVPSERSGKLKLVKIRF
jgi:hypothetical protein